MIDRTLPPPIQTVTYPRFAWPSTHLLQEEIPLFVLHAGTQPMLKLELVCNAGTWYEPHNGVAYFTTQMLLEGSENKNAQEIAQYIDQYGASVHAQIHPDTCTLTLITLTKYLKPMLVLLTELLLYPTFPEDRLTHLKHLATQALKIEKQRNSHVSRKHFKELLFGKAHPYGRRLTHQAIACITRTHVEQYWRKRLFIGCRVLVSGQVQAQDLRLVQHVLRVPIHSTLPIPEPTTSSIQAPRQVHIKKKKSLQSALSMGKVLIPKHDPDYLPLLVVNELLGGYFGSRLMRNIREDKGYTYGIFSRIVSLRQASYLLIATEIAKNHVQATLQEIKHEIEVLRTTLVPEQELNLLRNYMLGSFLSEINDPFSLMKQFKAVALHGIGQSYYERLFNTIQHIDASQIMTLASKYLVEDSLHTVVVG